MTASIHAFPTFTQAARAESERNAVLEADNAWLERRLVEATVANSELAGHVVAAEERAEKAERWVRARVVELTWPACICALVGAFAATFVIRWAGL